MWHPIYLYVRAEVLHGQVLFVLQSLTCQTAHKVKKIIILRQVNLSKHCLLRFTCLNIKIPPAHVPQSTSKSITEDWTFLDVRPKVYVSH